MYPTPIDETVARLTNCKMNLDQFPAIKVFLNGKSLSSRTSSPFSNFFVDKNNFTEVFFICIDCFASQIARFKCVAALAPSAHRTNVQVQVQLFMLFPFSMCTFEFFRYFRVLCVLVVELMGIWIHGFDERFFFSSVIPF